MGAPLPLHVQEDRQLAEWPVGGSAVWWGVWEEDSDSPLA